MSPKLLFNGVIMYSLCCTYILKDNSFLLFS